MKVCIKFLFLLLFSCQCFAESSEGLSFEYKVAIRDGAKAKVTVHVIDDNGLSLSNVNVRIYFRMTSGSSQGTVEQGKTNEDGTFCAEGRTTGFVFVSAEKENYYVSLTKYKASSLAPEKLHEGKWLPWNPTISVVLREIQNPVPMYVSVAAAKNNRWHMIPFPANVEVGFDCKKNAFVAPYGNGEISDFVVRVSSLSLPEEFQKK